MYHLICVTFFSFYSILLLFSFYGITTPQSDVRQSLEDLPFIQQIISSGVFFSLLPAVIKYMKPFHSLYRSLLFLFFSIVY
jgi:hypothetical protein